MGRTQHAGNAAGRAVKTWHGSAYTPMLGVSRTRGLFDFRQEFCKPLHFKLLSSGSSIRSLAVIRGHALSSLAGGVDAPDSPDSPPFPPAGSDQSGLSKAP